MKTLAEELRDEERRFAARFIHHARPNQPLSLAEAMELAQRVEDALRPVDSSENDDSAE